MHLSSLPSNTYYYLFITFTVFTRPTDELNLGSTEHVPRLYEFEALNIETHK